MKISFDNDALSQCSWGGTNNHWLLDFDDGVMEHVSSGSPLFDQNKRVVGQLHGNQSYNQYVSYCNQPRAEYGEFNLSWTGGGTINTSLSDWLADESGVMTINTVRPSISVSFNMPSTLLPNSNNSFSVNCSSCNPDRQSWEVYTKVYKPTYPNYEWQKIGKATSYQPNGTLTLNPNTVYFNDHEYALDIKVKTVLNPGGQIYSESDFYIYCPTCSLHFSYDTISLTRAFAPAVNINAYPSPGSSVLNVEIDASAYDQGSIAEQPVFEIRLISLTGVQILRTTGRGNDVTRLNVSNIPNDIYMLHVYDGTGAKLETRKVILSH
jgi:hypothetical protein